MSGFYKMLTTEANVKLTDKSNFAFNKLSGKTHQISNYNVTFHRPKDHYTLGTVEFKDENSTAIKAFYNIYIKHETVYASLYTLEHIMLIDTPFRSFLNELKWYVATDNRSMANSGCHN
jgi:hypothetical protein